MRFFPFLLLCLLLRRQSGMPVLDVVGDFIIIHPVQILDPHLGHAHLTRPDCRINRPVTAASVLNTHWITVHISLILSGFSHSHDCLLSWPGGSESRVPGTDFRPKVPRNRQKCAGKQGYLHRVPSAVFLTADFHGMSYPASLRTCGRYEFLSEHLLDTHQNRHPKMQVLVNTQSFFLLSAGSFILSFPKLLR